MISFLIFIGFLAWVADSLDIIDLDREEEPVVLTEEQRLAKEAQEREWAIQDSLDVIEDSIRQARRDSSDIVEIFTFGKTLDEAKSDADYLCQMAIENAANYGVEWDFKLFSPPNTEWTYLDSGVIILRESNHLRLQNGFGVVARRNV